MKKEIKPFKYIFVFRLSFKHLFLEISGEIVHECGQDLTST